MYCGESLYMYLYDNQFNNVHTQFHDRGEYLNPASYNELCTYMI